MVNGHSGHSRKHSAATTPVPKMPIVIKKSAPPSQTMSIAPPSPPATRRDLTFGEQPAFVRTVEGMAAWSALDREPSASVEVKLEPEKLAGPSRGSSESEEDDEFAMEPVNGEVGDKRKLAVNGDVRPRKKARTRLRTLNAVVDPIDLWWEVSTSSTLMANALPTSTYPSSATIEPLPTSQPLSPKPRRKKKKKQPSEC
ncbi:SPT7_1 [Sanghuangporus sanghuang]